MSERHLSAAFKSTDPSGTLFVNTFSVHQVWDNAFTTPGMGLTCESVANWLKDDYLAMLVPAYSLGTVAIRELGVDEPKVAEIAIDENGTCSGVSGELPVEVCMVLSFKTEVATRAARGRIFVPSPRGSTPLQSPDKWDPDTNYWEHAQTFGETLLTSPVIDYGPLDAYSFSLTAEVWSRVNQNGHDITSVTRRPRPHWLRSRSTAP